MYLAHLRIQNFRCFADETIHFRPGVNVLIGENNAGKTTVTRALSLLLEQEARRRPQFFDFHNPPADLRVPPSIIITATFRSNEADTIEDKALVASWLTRIEPPWEAQLVYTFMLEVDDETHCTKDLQAIAATDHIRYRKALERYLPKYVTKIFGGTLVNRLVADRESLDKIHLRTLDALRDAGRELFSGSNPLLRRLLQQIRDHGKTDAEREDADVKFADLAKALGSHMRGRIDLDLLIQLVTDTGTLEGGKPHLADEISEEDIISALRLYVATNGISLPAELNGLGYNNLIYISLILASLDHKADPATSGPNAAVFPMLCIEEPEAHLHPALQYKLLKHIERRVSEKKRNRQVFITTHSTQVTSASSLDQLICLTIPEPGGSPHRARYPGKCFSDDAAGKESKAYVERYLDATKSNLLFSKGVIFVEGLAELLLLPVFAELITCSLEEHHVAIIAVGGITFRHFLPLFGAGLSPEQLVSALDKPVACLVDADPTRRKTGDSKARFEKCCPYHIDAAQAGYEYKPISDALASLDSLCAGHANIQIQRNTKTLEYDIAFCNHRQAILVTEACTYSLQLKEMFGDPAISPEELLDRLAIVRSETANITSETERHAHVIATTYLHSLERAKGEHAFSLARNIKEATPAAIATFVVPNQIRDAIRWASRQPNPNAGASAPPAQRP